MCQSEAEIRKRKFFQRLKNSTHEHAWNALNELLTYCYERGQQHMIEAMSVHPRISKPMIEQVKMKSEEICTVWDGIGYIDAYSVLEEMFLGPKKP